MYEILKLLTDNTAWILSGIGVSLLSLIIQLLGKLDNKKNKLPSSEPEIPERIKMITEQLKISSTEIDMIEKELLLRIEKVNSLKAEAEQAEKIINIRKDQVETMIMLLRKELKNESKKGFLQGLIINFIFFIFGAVVSYLISKYT